MNDIFFIIVVVFRTAPFFLKNQRPWAIAMRMHKIELFHCTAATTCLCFPANRWAFSGSNVGTSSETNRLAEYLTT